MKGITYFRLKSPYEGDITKNCALDGYEVDNNFFTLEGRDIKSVSVDGNDLVITLLNGETIEAKSAFASFTKDISFDFDTTKGVLYIQRNGELLQEISGFATSYTAGETVAVDGTLKGNGKPYNPIGISPMHQTGMYRPVKKILDAARCEKLPPCEKLMPGDRFVTAEDISNYGLLYDYEGIRKIACDLAETHSGWRIPTKEDWDDMLNAIEPCENDRNHAVATSNKYLGKFAGKFLKSKDFWRLEDGCKPPHNNHHDFCDCDGDCNCGHDHGHHKFDDSCFDPYCGEMGKPHHKPEHNMDRGIDKYGFWITPTGYADDGDHYGYFLERAWYWTATNSHYTNAYTKRFEYDKSSVYQDITPTSFHLSLRLVKDYDGDNYVEREQILGGTYSTVLMPSQKNGKAIWTSVNFASPNKSYRPMLPNDGMGISLSKKYFINEWTGKDWKRNELHEGESVVVEFAPNGNRFIEYRLVDGRMENVAKSTFEDVMSAVHPKLDGLNNKIDEETARAIAKENEIDANLMAEIDRSTTRDEELSERIQEEASERQNADDVLHNRIEDEAKIRDEHDAAIKQALEDEAKIRDEHDVAIKDALDHEIHRAEEAEKNLSERIDEDAKIRDEHDVAIKDALDNEIHRAEEAEKNLSERIDEEAKIRDEHDAALKQALEDEIERSIKTDDDLRKMIELSQEITDDIKNALKAETDAREKADTILQQNIDEVAHNLDDLSKHVDDIDARETERHEEVLAKIEEERQNRISNDEQLQANIDAEAENRQAKDDELVARDAEIEAQLLSKDGTEFNKDNGILTLKSQGSTNDIQVQFSFNFGDI